MKESNVYKRELRLFRKEINKIDNQIIELLNKRGKIVQKIGNLKKIVDLDVFQPQREKEIIKRMKNKSKLLNKVSIEAIWKEIIDACKIIQDMEVSD